MQVFGLMAVRAAPVKVDAEILLESAAVRNTTWRLLFSLDLRHLALY